MFATAYDTLACRIYDRSAITRGLNQARIEDHLHSVETPYQRQKVKRVYRLDITDDVTPAFTQPFPYSGMDDHELVYIIDGRLFFKPSRGMDLSLSNADEYLATIKRAILTHYWTTHQAKDLLSTGELPVLVFCRWLAETLSKRFGLSPVEQSKAVTITYGYWYHLFRSSDEATLSERDILKLTQRLGQLTPIPTTLSLELMEALPPLADIGDYVDALQTHVGSARLEKLTPAFLYSMLGGSWFGLNSRETVAIALEHPPTFLSLIDAGLTSRNYRQSVIGRLVYENNKRDRGTVFSRSLHHFLNDYLGD